MMPTVNIHRETGKALTSINVYRAVKMDLRSKCALQNHEAFLRACSRTLTNLLSFLDHKTHQWQNGIKTERKKNSKKLGSYLKLK